jgi:hypothetical protein
MMIFRARQVNSWRLRYDVIATLREDPTMVYYDHHDPLIRGRVTEEQMAKLVNDEERANDLRIFDSSGYEIPIRLPTFLRETRPFGGLIDFLSLHELFTAPIDDDDNEADAGCTPYAVYPQAGLLGCGHVVGKDLMFPFQRFVQELNRCLGCAPGEEDDEDDQMTGDHLLAVQGIGCQLYNSLMHHTRGNSTQQHGVVLGNVTAALAGYWAHNTPCSNKARRFLDKCDKRFPHEEYFRKITEREISRDLRLENVIGISMSAIHIDKRSGRYVMSYTSIYFSNPSFS